MFKPLTTKFRIILVFARQNFFLIVLGLLAGIGLFQLVPHLAKRWQTHNQQQHTIGLIGNYTLETLPSDIKDLISMGLTRITPEGNATPAAAISWEIKNQGKTYTFALDQQLKWHDGKQLDAKQINYQIKGVEIKIIAKDKIEFHLKEPFAPFLVATSHPLFRKKTIGLGNYKIKSLTTRYGNIVSKLELEPVDRTKNKEKYTFNFYPTQEMLRNAFVLGEVKEAWGAQNIEEFKKWSNVKITPQRELNNKYAAVFFNTQKTPFSEKRFRQALAYAIKKPKKEARALGPISPLSWAYNKSIKAYDFNPSHAKKILKEAKIEPGQIEIKLTTFSGLLPWAEKIKSDWEAIGIKTTIGIENPNFQGEDFDALLAFGPITPDPDQYYLWHSNQAGNITKFSNQRIDKLLEEGRQIFVKEKRKEVYQDFQRFLVEESPAIFLYYPESFRLSRQPVIQF